MLSLPPVNHLANGRSHSSVVWNGSNQSIRSRASVAQNASKSASASTYRSAVAFAWADERRVRRERAVLVEEILDLRRGRGRLDGHRSLRSFDAGLPF